MPPKKQASTRGKAGLAIFDVDRIRSVMKDIPAPKNVEDEAYFWVEAFCPASVANEVFEHWQETANAEGEITIGVIGEYAPTTLSPNGYWCEATCSLHFGFPNAARATKWANDQCPPPFSARIQAPDVNPEEDPAWAYNFPTIEIAPGTTNDIFPEVVLRIQGSGHCPVSSGTWDTVIAILERLHIVGHIRDEHRDHVVIPVCRKSQAQALQATLVGQLPAVLLVDLILPEELGSEPCFLAVTVKSASTGTDTPPDHRLLDTMIEELHGFSVGHAGNPNVCDPENPFQSVMGFRSILGALLFRVAWRQLRIGGDNLQWTLHGTVKEEPIPSGVGSDPPGLKRRRLSSPTSGSGQGRVKRQRREGGNSRNSEQGSVGVQGGHGHSPSDPIEIDSDDQEMLAPTSSLVDLVKDSAGTPPTIPGPKSTPNKQVLPLRNLLSVPRNVNNAGQRPSPLKATVWVRANCPLGFGRDVFAGWAKSLQTTAGIKFGFNPSKTQDIETSLLGFPIQGIASLYIGFPSTSSADSWKARYDKPPFYVSVLKQKYDPTKEVGWQPGMPYLENFHEPDAIIRVTAKEGGGATMEKRKRWMAQLALFDILAFNNHADNSVWIPARTFAVGEEFLLRHWMKSGSWIPETTAVVIRIPDLQMKHAHLGITMLTDHLPESSKQRHKRLEKLLLEFFRDRLETVKECLPTSRHSHHTAVSFKTIKDAMKYAVIWHEVWPDVAKCFLRGPATQGATALPLPFTQSASAHRRDKAAPPPARTPVFTMEDETDEEEDAAPPPARTPVFTVEDETDEEEEGSVLDEEMDAKPTRVKVVIPPLLNLAIASPDEVEKIKAESRNFISSWFITHKATVPSEEEIQQVLDLLPDTPLWYSALSTARQNRGNATHALITAISAWNMQSDRKTIGPTTPAIYIASVQAVAGCIDDLCARIGNVNGTQRERMRKEMTGIAEDLSAAGHGPKYIVSLLYAGSTWNLGKRSRLDAKNFMFKGTPSQDRRQPLIVAETIAGGATTERDCSFVSLKPDEGGAFLHGYSDTILGPDGQIRRDEHGNIKFPAVCRLPVISILHAPRHLWHLLEAIVAALCSPAQLNVQLGGLARHRLEISMVELLRSRLSLGADAEVLFLGDATGVKGRSFGDSITGHLFVLMVEDYTGQKNVVIRMSRWHSDVGHESNDKIVTPDDIKKIKLSIKDEDLVLCIFGATVAGTNTWGYLFDGDVPDMDKTPFFEPFTAKVLGKKRVIILLPHIGVLNHVGELDWIVQSFADAIPITLMLGTFAKTVKADSSIPSHSAAAAAVLELYRKSEVCNTFSQRLDWPKLRSFWNGKTAPRVQRQLDQGVTWNKVYAAVAKELKMSVVLTLGVSDPDATPILIPGQAGSWDTTIRVCDAETGEVVAGPFEGHSSWVNSVAFSPNGARIVSASHDKTIRVWDTETGGVVGGPFEGHLTYVTSVAFSPNGTHIASGSWDKTIRVWNAETGEVVGGPFEGHSDYVLSVAFSPDGASIISGSMDKTIRVWDAEAREVATGPLEGHSDRVSCVAFSPNGTRIVSGSWDTTVRVWDAETGEVVAGPFEGHSAQVSSVAFSPNGTRVVSGSWDNTIWVWDAEMGKVAAGPFIHSDVFSVAFSPDGKRVISVSHEKTIRVWDVETSEVVVGPFEGHSDSNRISSVAFSPNGTRIVSTGSEMIWVLDAGTGKVASGPFKGHRNDVSSVAFSPNGTHVVSGSWDRRVRVWDAETGELVAGPFEGHSDSVICVAFSPDGTHIVSGSDDNTIRVWETETGGVVPGPWERHNRAVTSVTFSPDGKRLVSASGSTIWVWDFLVDKSNYLDYDLPPFSRSGTQDGWILGSNSELLLWVPPALRDGLCWPNNRLALGNFIKTTLDLTHFVHGGSWSQCQV